MLVLLTMNDDDDDDSNENLDRNELANENVNNVAVVDDVGDMFVVDTNNNHR